jgi:hypothetical protein
MNLEKMLFPDLNKLITEGTGDESFAHAKILDAELDVIQCTFLGDGTLTIDTTNFDFITLTNENLNNLKKLLKKAEEFYSSVQEVV